MKTLRKMLVVCACGAVAVLGLTVGTFSSRQIQEPSFKVQAAVDVAIDSAVASLDLISQPLVGLSDSFSLTVYAQSTNGFPNAEFITTSVQGPFNTALTWWISAAAVLGVVGWVSFVIRSKKR